MPSIILSFFHGSIPAPIDVLSRLIILLSSVTRPPAGGIDSVEYSKAAPLPLPSRNVEDWEGGVRVMDAMKTLADGRAVGGRGVEGHPGHSRNGY